MEETQKTYSQKTRQLYVEDRVKIGLNFSNISKWRQLVAIPFIYVPIIVTVPFAMLGAIFTVIHLKILGAKNLKTYRDFIPKHESYRYPKLKDYIVIKPTRYWNFHLRFKFFWYFNCTLYCPQSVGLFEYMSYLVKIVENWWCPFYHDKKDNYAVAAMDRSFWHTYTKWKKQMHEEDSECPIWNDKSIHLRQSNKSSQTPNQSDGEEEGS